MDVEGSTGNSILYLLLLSCTIMVIVDTSELILILKSWGNINSASLNIFETCVKWESYTKTLFCTYSLLGALSALILIIFLMTNANYFIQKIATTFRMFNYIIFGPYMLGFTLIGIYNWNSVVYVCDKQNFNNKNFSFLNMFSLIACFLLSLFITLLVLIIKTMTIYLNSILNRPGGSPLIKKLFWKVVFRNLEPVQFVRSVQRDNEERKENV